ncbi:MAG: hypothetical protein DDG60_12650 [Anaerolineae bacterium]|nr:MAG: hypothetical protein DDG60_12650 [Anaerolineae bacterium]
MLLLFGEMDPGNGDGQMDLNTDPRVCYHSKWMMQPSFEIDTTSQEAISKYLATTFGISAYEGKVFCSYQLMGYGKEKEDRAKLYLWVECQEFYIDQERVLRAGSGINLPVVVYLLKTDTGYQIVESQRPGEGEAYANDVRELFPQNLWATIFPNPDETPPYASYNTRAEMLYNVNQQSALLFFLLSEPGEWNIAIPLPVP